MAFPALILWLSLAVDRIFGDPPNAFHPTAHLGRFIGWWGQPGRYPAPLQRSAGVVGALATASLFALPFLLVDMLAPPLLLLVTGPVLLKLCFAWRCLEEHVGAVERALEGGMEGGREKVGYLVSRATGTLDEEGVRSAAYESMTENLVDSIVSPLFFYTLFGLGGAAFYRAVNTMDAMLGYKDERALLGWFPARLDDLLNLVPARLTGLFLLLYFATKGRLQPALRMWRRDARKRSGINGGIPMAVMAGGVGIRFEKPGGYVIGEDARSLQEAGAEIVAAVRAATLLAALLFGTTLVFITIVPTYLW
ncbi:MAG: adenosylcobinamide-phosphate synthase CbiB [Methanomicrobiaceae archaeon]|nr:adenosylcobinamide-phosphate synthase CbiB [Methanomicrobiaceae archaeon]